MSRKDLDRNKKTKSVFEREGEKDGGGGVEQEKFLTEKKIKSMREGEREREREAQAKPCHKCKRV